MLFPAWDARRQTLHDKVTNTVVVKRGTLPSPARGRPIRAVGSAVLDARPPGTDRVTGHGGGACPSARMVGITHL